MMMLLPDSGPPVTAGEILEGEFLIPLGLTQTKLAQHLGWKPAKINEIINGKRGVTPETALALADAFETSPDFWLNAQKAWDLWQAMQRHNTVPSIRRSSK